MKRIIIIRTTGGELANQLWNYASVYAYCKERGYELLNPNFYEYGNYFNIPAPSKFLNIFFSAFINYPGRKDTIKRRLWRKLYSYYSSSILAKNKMAIIVSDNKEGLPFYLPPTKENEKLSVVEKNNNTIYFDGWLFRNPVGVEKYRKEIMEYLRPRQDINSAVEAQVSSLQKKFKNIVGVHIRQGDYKIWRGGVYYINQSRIREILEEYLKENNLKNEEICFAIASDGKVDKNLFNGLNVFLSKANLVYDLLFLSKTSTIIGSNGTFGAFASYLGNIPFIVMENGRMDWSYYKNKNSYFENKYSTFVYY